MSTIFFSFIGKTCWNLWQCGEWKNFTYLSNFRTGEKHCFECFCSSLAHLVFHLFILCRMQYFLNGGSMVSQLVCNSRWPYWREASQWAAPSRTWPSRPGFSTPLSGTTSFLARTMMRKGLLDCLFSWKLSSSWPKCGKNLMQSTLYLKALCPSGVCLEVASKPHFGSCCSCMWPCGWWQSLCLSLPLAVRLGLTLDLRLKPAAAESSTKVVFALAVLALPSPNTTAVCNVLTSSMAPLQWGTFLWPLANYSWKQILYPHNASEVHD